MSGMNLAPYREFAKGSLGFDFKNIELLVTALTHRSYVNEHRKSTSQHNERLEFLGDAVLELVTTRFLFDNYSEPEGILTSWRSALVRTESIGAAGKDLGYEPLIRMSRGEKRGSERARDHILANAFEALIGAIYLDQGYDVAAEFISKHILSKTEQILNDKSWRDPKSYLQEVAQQVEGKTPSYKVLREDGPDHDKVFEIGVFVSGKLQGKGSGSSKQAAQQEAAKDALEHYEKR
ncbi:MAG: ribonuclease III [Candidatus Nomurabacteria bacterium]|jgi:ribonuclease-3|nr:ribonuclease III [Candidatus Nomurabacteria bacterium]